MHSKEYPPVLIPKQQAFAACGVGNTKGYELISQGLLVALKIDGKTVITAESLQALPAKLPRLPVKAA